MWDRQAAEARRWLASIDRADPDLLRFGSYVADLAREHDLEPRHATVILLRMASGQDGADEG